jgi:hypothetical protein
MTTCSDLIQAALREGNLLAAGVSPTSVEQSEALGRLNAYNKQLFGVLIGEYNQDWLVPAPQRTAPQAANYPQLPYPIDTLGDAILPSSSDLSDNIWPFPPQNSRLVVAVTSAATVYFPEAPNDGARMSFVATPEMSDTLTLDGNGKAIEGVATKDVTAADTGRKWFFRADLANWVALTTLGLTDTPPLPDEFDDLYVTALAIRLSSRYGQDPRAGTQNTYKDMLKQAKTRFAQSGNTIYRSNEIPRGLESYLTGRWQW